VAAPIANSLLFDVAMAKVCFGRLSCFASLKRGRTGDPATATLLLKCSIANTTELLLRLFSLQVNVSLHRCPNSCVTRMSNKLIQCFEQSPPTKNRLYFCWVPKCFVSHVCCAICFSTVKMNEIFSSHVFHIFS